MSVAEQVAQRLGSLDERIRALTASFDDDDDDAAPTPHRRVLAQLAGARWEQANSATNLDERMRLAVHVEELLRFARELQSQYTDTNLGPLQVASYVARECYQQVVRSGLQLGASSLLERWPEPAIVLEPMQSPVTYVRDTSAKWLGFAPRQAALLPFPLVLMPAYPVGALSGLCLIHHEVGHNVDRDLELSSSLKAALETRLEQGGVHPELTTAWLAWTEEIVADAFGAMFAGPAFALELAKWAAVYGDNTAGYATQPFTSLRVRLANELLALSGVPTTLLRARAAPPEPTAMAARFVEHVSLVARAIFDTEIHTLGDASLFDLRPDVAEEARVVEAAATTLRGSATGQLGELPLRLFPSAAGVAEADGADPLVVGTKLLAEALRPARGPSAVPFAQARWLQTTAHAVVPPILDEERDGLKLPPPTLFRDVRNVSFVGATNDALGALFAKHSGPRKQCVEVFFLSAQQLTKLDGPLRSSYEMLQLGRAGRTGLTRTLLDRLAQRWTLYEHDEPFVFASYWDAEEPGGRIHVSAHGWGQDIKRAPSHDYVWPSSAPRPERSYQFFRQALSALRSRARAIASSQG